MNRDYKDDQKRTRAALAPVPMETYQFNRDYNRAARRRTRDKEEGRRLKGVNIQTVRNEAADAGSAA